MPRTKSRRFSMLMIVILSIFSIRSSVTRTSKYRDILKSFGDGPTASALEFLQQQTSAFNYAGSRKVDITRQDLINIAGSTTQGIRRIRQNVSSSASNCRCVHCEEDPLCGRLWHGYQPYGTMDERNIHDIPLHVVVSFCKGDLSFIGAITEGFHVASIHVISKCGREVKHVPNATTVEVLPNVGRCDHSYAHYMNVVLDQKLKITGTENDNALVVFLKDNIGARNLHQAGLWSSLSTMVEVASSEAGFACGMTPHDSVGPQFTLRLSANFKQDYLKQFHIEEYSSRRNYNSDEVQFKSKYRNLGELYDHVGASSIKEDMVPVCFGGVFVASVNQIHKRDKKLWKAIGQALSRGDNIEEGHYVERMWAMLLSSPLKQYQREAIKEHADYALEPGYSKKLWFSNEAVVGMFVKKVQKEKKKGYGCNSDRHCWAN
eukprot:scaffold92_cov85-Cylindrotheca_fusiformis.AAC.8